MIALREPLAEYLAVRRALGYRLERTEKLLGQFLDHLEATRAEQITVERALAWATLPAGSTHWHAMRLQAVRGFARYLHEVDPLVEVPATELLPDRPHRATPYLYTDRQILALMSATSTLRTPHRAATFRTLFGVLAVTGMRIGEAIGLDRSDFDPDHGVLVVRHGKFGKSRELPLHPSATGAVRRYLRRRDRPRPTAPTDALLVSSAGTRLLIANVQTSFRTLRARAGILPRSAACRPRLHDARHSFAVHTLLDAYRTDGDVAPTLAVLSTYLGHVDPGKTYWYLQAAPELMQLASERLERHLGAGR
ncbi:MAG: tyrosine-type recombinase/integrase [Actinobacteria bacterium]|nr:tyrosine-type recombinase/integrase [Actinomycetota bacterium]